MTKHFYVKFIVAGTPRTEHLSPILSVHRLDPWRDNSALLADIRCRLEDQERCQVQLCTASHEEWDEYITPYINQLDYLLGRQS